jgi:hypothetical protein
MTAAECGQRHLRNVSVTNDSGREDPMLPIALLNSPLWNEARRLLSKDRNGIRPPPEDCAGEVDKCAGESAVEGLTAL